MTTLRPTSHMVGVYHSIDLYPRINPIDRRSLGSYDDSKYKKVRGGIIRHYKTGILIPFHIEAFDR